METKIVLQTSRLCWTTLASLVAVFVCSYLIVAIAGSSSEELKPLWLGAIFAGANLSIWAFISSFMLGEGQNKAFWTLQLVFLKLLLILMIFQTVRYWPSSSLGFGLAGFLAVNVLMLIFLGFLPKKADKK